MDKGTGLSPEEKLVVIEKLMEKAEELDLPLVKHALQEILRDSYREIDAEIFFRDNRTAVV